MRSKATTVTKSPFSRGTYDNLIPKANEVAGRKQEQSLGGNERVGRLARFFMKKSGAEVHELSAVDPNILASSLAGELRHQGQILKIDKEIRENDAKARQRLEEVRQQELMAASAQEVAEQVTPQLPTQTQPAEAPKVLTNA